MASAKVSAPASTARARAVSADSTTLKITSADTFCRE